MKLNSFLKRFKIEIDWSKIEECDKSFTYIHKHTHGLCSERTSTATTCMRKNITLILLFSMLCIKSTLLDMRSLSLTSLSLYCTPLCLCFRLSFLLSRSLYLLLSRAFTYTYNTKRNWIRDEAQKMKGYFAASMWVITGNEWEYKRI